MSVEAFKKLCLNDKQIAECLKKPKLTQNLELVIEAAKVHDTDKTTGALLLTLAQAATKDTGLDDQKTSYIARAIGDGRLLSTQQLDAAIEYCVKTDTSNADTADFNNETGVGQSVSPEELRNVVDEYLAKNSEILQSERYKFQGTAMKEIRADPRLRWANMAELKPAVDAAILSAIGAKDERDAPAKKVKPVKTAETSLPSQARTDHSSSAPISSLFTTGLLGQLHKVGENPQISDELRRKHVKAVNGKVHTRFPPEPNGYLHIGHSKAIAVNFGYARAHDGVCYLRFDDTNPEKEEEKYFTAIEAMIKWLGFSPYKVTYSSDYFQELYELAEDLISRDKAYTCDCSDEQVKQNRGGEERGPRVACEHRLKPVATSLDEFRAMKNGKYPPKGMTLRMKQDLEDGNPQMWDLIAYRVLLTPHHRTGTKWKVYPTYDFTHCLVDSFENITHSLCTTEFVQSRVSYEWLCDVLEVYKPAQREYGRLNLQGTIMSKRKIEKLVSGGYVRDWNDPRLYTLVALRRRGVPPGAILTFVSELGVTTSVTNIQAVRFDNVVRNYLELSVPRLMMILDPVKVILDNLKDDYLEECVVPFSPKDSSMGDHIVPLTKILYIDRSDFRSEDSKDYFRLAPGKSVGLLKAAHTVRATSFETSSDGRVSVVHAHYENDIPFKKPKTYIQWVAESSAHSSPVRIDEVRIHHQLFHSDNPSDHPAGFLADINPNSEEIIKGALVETGFHELTANGPWPKVKREEGQDDKSAPESTRFQALRVGYFCTDSDSTAERIVLNRIVSLREDATKKLVG